MAFSLHNRVALVTGSSKGLGKAMAMALGEVGAKVAINYCNDEQKAEETFAEFQQKGYQGMLIQADASDEKQIGSMCARIKEELGSIDILVVNATPDQPQKRIEEYSWADYQRMIDFFIKSPFLLTQAVVGDMKSRQWGRIINIGSEVFQLGTSNFSAYVSAKGGQAGFTRSVARELAPSGITVNLIAPGWIPVERHEQDPQSAKDAYTALVPAGHMGVPEDVAGAVVYFASEEASFVTGQTVCVNGGLAVL